MIGFILLLLRYLFALIQWLFETTFNIIYHVISNVVAFPLYVFDTLNEARLEIFKFFFRDLPWYASALCSTFVFLYNVITATLVYTYEFFMDRYEDIAEVYTYIAHEYWLDDTRTFGSWLDLVVCMIGFLVLSVILLLCILNGALEESSATRINTERPPRSHIRAAEEGHSIGAVHRDVESNPGSPTSASSVSSPPIPVRPIYFSDTMEIFRSPNKYFNTTNPIPWKTTYNLGLPECDTNFLDLDAEKKTGSERVFMYGDWRWRRSTTADSDVSMNTVIEEPEEPRRQITNAAAPVQSLEASRPLSEVVEIVAAPHKVLPHIPSLSPLLRHEFTEAPPPATASPATEVVEDEQAAISPQDPSPEDVLVAIFRSLGERTGTLREAMLLFLTLIITASEGYAEPGDIISNLISIAQNDMKPFLEYGITSQQCLAFPWSQLIIEFWSEVLPHGHIFINHANRGVYLLLDQVHTFGTKLGLQLQDPNMTPPPPSPPMLQIAPASPMEQQIPPPPSPPMLRIIPAPTIEKHKHHREPSEDLQAPGKRVRIGETQPPRVESGASSTHASTAPEYLEAVQPQPQPTPNPPNLATPPVGPNTEPQTPARSIKQPRRRPRPAVAVHVPMPAPVIPQPVLSPSTQPQQKEAGTKQVRMIRFDDLEKWAKLDEDEITGLTRNHLGFISDSRFWNFSAEDEIELIDDEHAIRDHKYVEAEFGFIAVEFKRAAVMLRMQAQSSPWRGKSEAPKLLQNMTSTLIKANHMHKACGEESNEDSWTEAILTLGNEVMQYDERKEKLREHYGDDAWEIFNQAFYAVEPHWLNHL